MYLLAISSSASSAACNHATASRSTQKVMIDIHCLDRHCVIHSSHIYRLVFIHTGTLLAVGSLKGYVTLWNLKSGAMVREIKEQGDTFHVSWSTDGKMLSSCFSKGLIHVMLVDDISV